MKNKEDVPVSSYYWSDDLDVLEHLSLYGFTFIQYNAYWVYLQQAPMFAIKIEAGAPLVWAHENECLTKEGWFDRLIDTIKEKKEALVERALLGS